MFNQAQFNQLKYNQATVSDIFARMQASGISGFSLETGKTTSTSATLNGEGGIRFSFGKITFTEILAKGVGGVRIKLGKSKESKAHWSGIGTFTLSNENYNIEIMEYYGQLKPNDRIIINTERFTVTKNNINTLEEFDGNFLSLKEGINEIIFEDNETSRTILIRVEHKDRHL